MVDGRNDGFLFFLPVVSIAVIGVEGQHGDTWTLYGEVAVQGGIEQSELLYETLLIDGGRHVLQRDVAGGKGYTHDIVDEDVESFLPVTDTALDEPLVAWEVEAVDVHVVLVDRSGDEHVEEIVFIVGDGAVDALDGSAAGILRRHAELYLHILVETWQQVELAVLSLVGAVDDAEDVALNAQRIAMVAGNLGRAIDNRCAEIEYCRVFECFEYQLVTYAIGVSVGDGHAYFPIVHILFICFY